MKQMSELFGITFQSTTGVAKQLRSVASLVSITQLEGKLGASFTDQDGMVQIDSLVHFKSIEEAFEWLKAT